MLNFGYRFHLNNSSKCQRVQKSNCKSHHRHKPCAKIGPSANVVGCMSSLTNQCRRFGGLLRRWACLPATTRQIKGGIIGSAERRPTLDLRRQPLDPKLFSAQNPLQCGFLHLVKNIFSFSLIVFCVYKTFIYLCKAVKEKNQKPASEVLHRGNFYGYLSRFFSFFQTWLQCLRQGSWI